MSTSASTLIERHRPKSPALQFALAAVVAILILSLWLHFFLALEIESTGREIDVKTEELERLQRENLAKMNQISLLDSQRRLASEATGMGFRPQQPLYLAVNRPLVSPASQAQESSFLSIWDVGAVREAAAAGTADERPGEPVALGMNVADLP